MSNLPIQFQDKINSPELLAFLQQFGEETYIDAALINKFRDAINELGLVVNPDRILTLGTETKVDNVYTYQNYVWILNTVEYTNTTPDVLTIVPATAGYKRKDIAVFTNLGTIQIVQGVETNGPTVTTPEVPEGTLYFKFYDINGATIVADPSTPITGETFIKKLELQTKENNQSGANVIINLPIYGSSVINLVNPLLTSISGVFYNFAFDLAAPIPYQGKRYTFRNLTGGPVTVIDNDLVTTFDSNFKTKDGLDFILPNNEMITFEYGERMTEIGARSWTNIDLSTKADLVGGKVPAAQLPSYVDDVLEFANLAAFPLTGESGKIYIAIDTNLQYRWGGSGYVAIGGGSSEDTFTLHFNQASRVWVLNTWYQRYSGDGFGISGGVTYGTGSVPTSAMLSNGSWLLIPSGYVVSYITFGVMGIGSALGGTNYKAEVYVTRGKIVEGQLTNTPTDIEVICQEEVPFQGLVGNPKFTKRLTIAEHLPVDFGVLQVSTREVLQTPASYGIFMNITFKKA